jgi:hypothetical protein
MGDVVQSKFCILYLKLGSVFYPIACGTDSTIEVSAEELEIAPRLSSDFREYRYGRKSGTITGTHLVKINTAPDNLYTVFDLLGYQLTSQRLLVKYSVEDGAGNTAVVECDTIIRKFSMTKTAGQALRGSYELLISGPPVLSVTPVENTNPQIGVFEYDANGDEASLELPFGDDATILVVYINGVSVRVWISPDGYGPGDVQYNPETKTLVFGTPLAESDYVKILYVDTVPADARTTGDGFRTTGDGQFRTTG